MKGFLPISKEEIAATAKAAVPAEKKQEAKVKREEKK